MEEILKTTLLEYGKSAFIIDLVKHKTGKQYVQITQTIEEEESYANRTIKINPSLLNDIVAVLSYFGSLIPGFLEKQPMSKGLSRIKIKSGGLTESAKQENRQEARNPRETHEGVNSDAEKRREASLIIPQHWRKHYDWFKRSFRFALIGNLYSPVREGGDESRLIKVNN